MDADDARRWLQHLIVCALHMGIGKRELMEAYYPDEIVEILRIYARMHGEKEETREEEVDLMEFLGM